MIKRGLYAFLLCLPVLISTPNEAVAAGENILFTSNQQVSLTSDVNGKVVPRGNITITVGKMLSPENTVACNHRSRWDACGYSLGLTLIKTPEKFSYDFAKYVGSCIIYYENPIQFEDYCNTFSQYGISNQSFGGIKTDVQFDGKNTNLTGDKYLQFTFSTVGWPGGEYTLMAFRNSGTRGAVKSDPLNFTLPAIPKTNIECTSPQSTYSGTAFSISCTSTLSLVSTPVNVILVRSASSDVLGRVFANGNTFEIPDVTIKNIGVAELQVSIPAIIDTLQSSTSNVMVIQVAPTDPIKVNCSGPATADAKSTLIFKCAANQIVSTYEGGLMSIWYKGKDGYWKWFADVDDVDGYIGWQTELNLRGDFLNDYGIAWNYNGTKIQYFRWQQLKNDSDTESLWVSNVIKVSVKGKGLGSSAPQGKIDRKSNSYKLMYNVGKNLARVSTPSDSAKSQCTSAKNTGFIKQNGRMNHLGPQYSFIQSHLRTASGYQGCIDGFNSL